MATTFHIIAAHVPLQGIHVLVVDDDESAREVLRTVLEAEGASVVTAASAVEALHELDDAVPDVLLTDIGMPVTDGFTLIESIRSRSAQRGGAVPAVALTGYMAAEDRARARRAGFHAYLIKPVDPGELVDVVRSLASTHEIDRPDHRTSVPASATPLDSASAH